MTKIVEYGTYEDGESSVTTTLAEAPMQVHPQFNVRLLHISAGFEPAGSVARWTDECWAYRYSQPGGTTHGRRFLSEREAREHFSRLTTDGSN